MPPCCDHFWPAPKASWEADALLLGTVNSSLPVAIDAELLAAAVLGEVPARPWRAHMIALFTEVGLNVLDCFLRNRRIPAGSALACYQSWVAPTDPKPTVEQWLVERRRLECETRDDLGQQACAVGLPGCATGPRRLGGTSEEGGGVG